MTCKSCGAAIERVDMRCPHCGMQTTEAYDNSGLGAQRPVYEAESEFAEQRNEEGKRFSQEWQQNPKNNENVPSYLWLAVIATVLGTWILGFVAIAYAARVRTLLHNGDIKGARTSSRVALIFSIIALVVGIPISLYALSIGGLLGTLFL